MEARTTHAHEGQRNGDRAAATLPEPLAGIFAGLAAGAAYLIAQMTFAATVLGGVGWEPLQRAAAILLGPDAAPPPAELSVNVVGFGLMIHFALAIVFGRIVEALVRRARPAHAAVIGGVIGLGLFVVNFWLVAPAAFPWFEDSRHLVTAADHWLFGAVAGATCAVLRGR